MTMAKKATYVATDPDGTEHTRTSTRTYTHAVLATDRNLDCYGNPVPKWIVTGFCGRPDLAEKLRGSCANWYHEVVVVAVVAR
ncbi:hypothetical protein [Mycolicibacterium conceptionense]